MIRHFQDLAASSSDFSFRKEVACVASVSVWFRSKERPRNGILGFGCARKEIRAIFRAVFDSRSSFFVPKRHGNACYEASMEASAKRE